MSWVQHPLIQQQIRLQLFQQQQNSATNNHPILSLPKSDFPKYETIASPPLPPDWEASATVALATAPLSPFHKIPLDPSSPEFGILNALVQPSSIPIKIQSIEKIINLNLMKKFLATRAELLISKSRDLKLLQELGLSESELMQSATINLNYHISKEMKEFQYSDNIALLFHCTRSKNNVELILEEGLDDRLGSRKGSTNGSLLGSGIYFTDDPKKALSYDSAAAQTLFIFAVYLGDCLGIWNSNERKIARDYVREPYKRKEERRNFRDKFFDSIVGRPNTSNEFVINNRYQCIPLYVVNYSRPIFPPPAPPPWLATQPSTDLFTKARKKLPRFAWPNDGKVPSKFKKTYPFFAQTIFRLMEFYENSSRSSQLQKDKNDESGDDGIESDNHENKIKKSLRLLSDLGFNDKARNVQLLGKHGFKMGNVIEELVSNEEVPAPAPAAASPGEGAGDTEETVQNSTGQIEMEECRICCEEYPRDCPISWKKLENCSHKLCTSCSSHCTKTGSPMSGAGAIFAIYTSLKCPFCNAISGTPIGSCPNGTMNVSHNSAWIRIEYQINGPIYYLRRKAYLPNEPEGRELLKLLEIAWERRHVFSIGTSVSNGQPNTLVWNIHHKTSKSGGPTNYGYPDPTYFLRLRQELKEYGII